MNKAVDEFCRQNQDRSKAFFSLGLKRYLSAMKYARVVVGNSSSGVVETPAFGTPTVNIGDRQKGRFIARKCNLHRHRQGGYCPGNKKGTFARI